MPKIQTNKKLISTICLLVFCIFFSGCAKAIDLTEQEEDAISAFSANVIAKFNRNMSKGATAVVLDEEPKEQEEKTEDSKETDSKEDNAKEEESKKDEGDTSSKGEKSEGEASGDDVASAKASSLTDIIGIEGLSFKFNDIYIAESYQLNDYLDLNPDRGKYYVVADYAVTNNLQEDLAVNLTEQKLKFTAAVGDTSISSDSTILPNDITSYNGTIGAGQTENMVVLFQLDAKKAPDDTSTITLGVRKDKTVYQIEK